MELTILGAHGTWPRPDGATSGYLVRHEGFTLWVDLGSGTMANLQRHVGLLDIDGVVVSHVHPDHLVDLYPYFYARHFSPQQPSGTPLWCPPGLIDAFLTLVGREGHGAFHRSFGVREIEPGASFEAGPFRVTTAPMNHPPPTLGLRLEADGAALAYTADTGPTPELVGMARDADLLLAEASWQEEVEGRAPIHLTATQAGEAASEAGAGRLVLTHIWPTLDRERSAEDARAAFHGEVVLASEGMVLEVRR